GGLAVQARARNRALDLAPAIQELQAAGCASLRTIAAGLEKRGIAAPRGGNWSAVQIARLSEAAAVPFDPQEPQKKPQGLSSRGVIMSDFGGLLDPSTRKIRNVLRSRVTFLNRISLSDSIS